MALAVSLVAVLGWLVSTSPAGESGAAVRVDFTTPVAATPRTNIGFTATTFGVEGGTVAENPRDAAALGRLGAGAVRIHLRSRSDGTVVTGAAGGAVEIPAARWLDTYCAMGVQLTVVLDLNRAVATDVAKYLRSSGCPVRRFVLGNEMDANSQADVPPDEYVRRFREIAKALRADDPTLQIGGPAPAYFETLSADLVAGLLQAPPDERASFIDYHAYGAGRGERARMSTSWQYGDQIDRLRHMIDDPAVAVQVGEFNLNWAEDPRDNTPFQTTSGRSLPSWRSARSSKRWRCCAMPGPRPGPPRDDAAGADLTAAVELGADRGPVLPLPLVGAGVGLQPVANDLATSMTYAP